MRDLTPEIANKHRWIEEQLIQIARQYGYDEIRFPTLEQSSLFEKSIGIETDVIGQEMYQFVDKNNDLISLRPEGTAGCLRSCISNGLIQRQRQKLYYVGQMFRRERPQKGRYREFTHFGIEAFGFPSGLIDVELITLSNDFWKLLNIKSPTLHINYLGSAASRAKYRESLYRYWQTHFSLLSEDEKIRAQQNPLRLLDSKNPSLSTMIKQAPSIQEFLSDHERQTYQDIKQQLNKLGIQFVENNSLVRGLDYYSDFIFEWITDDLGAQGTICGGGRYDVLTENMGCATPAIGFAIGIDRLALLIESIPKQTSIYLCSEDSDIISQQLDRIQKLRSSLNFNIYVDFKPKKLKKIHQAQDKGFTHSIIFEHDQYKFIDHQKQTIETYSFDRLTSQLKQLEH